MNANSRNQRRREARAEGARPPGVHERSYPARVFRTGTIWSAVFLLVVGVNGAGIAAAGQIYRDGQRMETPPDEPTVSYLTGWLHGASCTGSATWKTTPGGETVKLLYDELGVLGETVPNPVAETNWLAAIAILVGVVALVVDIGFELQDAEERLDSYLHWNYACSATGYGLEANGVGGILRRVSIEVGSSAGYTEVGAACEYYGEPLQATCSVPATYDNPSETPANASSGVSRCCTKLSQGYALEDPPPMKVNVCVSPDVRAVNAQQHDALTLAGGPFRSAYQPYDQVTCVENVCIVWAEYGCQAD